jgi:hypothetical protein
MNYGAAKFPISLLCNEFGWDVSPMGVRSGVSKTNPIPVSARGETNPMDAAPA